jgi:hypothetical protein
VSWTINDAPDLCGAILTGVGGIVTDDPGALRGLLAELRDR